MCLDPRPDRTPRLTRTARRLIAPRQVGPTPRLSHAALTAPQVAPIVRAPALWALDALAGDDELVSRGWVVLSSSTLPARQR